MAGQLCRRYGFRLFIVIAALVVAICLRPPFLGGFMFSPTATSTTVSASLGTITLGDTVTFTATVTAATGTPTGLVTFFDGTTPLGSGTLRVVAGKNVATFSTALLSAAASPLSYSITAVYQGDATHTGSSSTAISETVNPRTSTTDMSLNPTSVVVGQRSTGTVTVTVTDSGSVTPGTVDTFTGTGAPPTGRTRFTSTLFADGLLLVAGGTEAGNKVLNTTEIYSVSNPNATFSLMSLTLYSTVADRGQDENG
jgi:Bacterial Ig-like domain (group 3)